MKNCIIHAVQKTSATLSRPSDSSLGALLSVEDDCGSSRWPYIVIGCVLGAVLLLAAVALFLYFYVFKRKWKARSLFLASEDSKFSL